MEGKGRGEREKEEGGRWKEGGKGREEEGEREEVHVGVRGAS